MRKILITAIYLNMMKRLDTMNKEEILKIVPEKIMERAYFIVICDKCKFYMWVDKESKYKKEEKKTFEKLIEKNALECPICRSKIKTTIDVEKKNELKIE